MAPYIYESCIGDQIKPSRPFGSKIHMAAAGLLGPVLVILFTCGEARRSTNGAFHLLLFRHQVAKEELQKAFNHLYMGSLLLTFEI